jgi:hypothetical protein
MDGDSRMVDKRNLSRIRALASCLPIIFLEPIELKNNAFNIGVIQHLTRVIGVFRWPPNKLLSNLNGQSPSSVRQRRTNLKPPHLLPTIFFKFCFKRERHTRSS